MGNKVCCCCANLRKWFHEDRVPIDIYDTVECAGTIISRDTVNLWYWVIFRVIAGLYVTFIFCWSQYRFISTGNAAIWWVYIRKQMVKQVLEIYQHIQQLIN